MLSLPNSARPVVFYGFMPGPDLMGTIGPTWLVLVWVIGYLAQVWLASVWLRHFRFGPVEWLLAVPHILETSTT